MNDFVSLPRWLVEYLLDVAKEHAVENEWKRGTTYKNSSEMSTLDDAISGVEQYLSDV